MDRQTDTQTHTHTHTRTHTRTNCNTSQGSYVKHCCNNNPATVSKTQSFNSRKNSAGILRRGGCAALLKGGRFYRHGAQEFLRDVSFRTNLLPLKAVQVM